MSQRETARRAAAKEAFIAYLIRNGLRLGREREEILDAVLSIENHFTLQELSNHLRRKGKKTHRATLYRNIPVLIESGIIGSVLVNRPGKQAWQVAYEHTYGHTHHDHLVCIRCQKVQEINWPPLEREQEKLCRSHRFTHIRHRLVVEGYCAACAKR